MDLNQVMQIANSAANGGTDFARMRWYNYKENYKEYKRNDLWTLKMLSPAKAIYYPGDEILNARMLSANPSRNAYTLKVGEAPDIRGYKSLGGQPNGFVDMSGSVTINLVDKQDYAIELWMKSTRDLISHPETRFSYPVELLVSQIELAYHNTIQQRTKVYTFIDAMPKSVDLGGDDTPATGDASLGGSMSYTWNYPWSEEEIIPRF